MPRFTRGNHPDTAPETGQEVPPTANPPSGQANTEAAEVVGHGRRAPMMEQAGDTVGVPAEEGGEAAEVVGHGRRAPMTEQAGDDADQESGDADLTAEAKRRA